MRLTSRDRALRSELTRRGRLSPSACRWFERRGTKLSVNRIFLVGGVAAFATGAADFYPSLKEMRKAKDVLADAIAAAPAV